MPQAFAGRTALVTGSGNGIGRATALALAARGATVGVNDLKPEFVERVVKEIGEAGGQAIGLVENVATREGMGRTVLGLGERTGRLDIMVNNAAWVRYQAIPDVAPETLDRMLDIGFKAVVWGIQAAAEAMDPARGGAIVNLASVAGIVSTRNSIVYSGIKAGIMGITRAAAAELGARHIRVNAVA
ncbi:MAG TPA: SDR family NAD(P)-dependent oxidoreductase, partial [Reyranellaceae bacterium]|nr:SDR family NAD(P)-dependent oxidoreductase [Reyranellaceae bacterium]